MTLLQLRTVTAAGTPALLGREQGLQLAGLAREFVAQRQRAAKVYLRDHGIRDAGTIGDLGRRCLEQLRVWDHEGWIEHVALAEGAGIDAAELYTAANYTDIRDIITFPADREAVVGTGAKPHPH